MKGYEKVAGLIAGAILVGCLVVDFIIIKTALFHLEAYERVVWLIIIGAVLGVGLVLTWNFPGKILYSQLFGHGF
jgi:hypothetical protein